MGSMTTYLVFIIAVLLISLFIGTPVSNAMGITAALTMLLFMGKNHFVQFAAISYQRCTNMNQIIAPLFILMAEFLALGGVAEDLFYVLNKYLKKLRGGLALSTTVACTIFAALCGSSPATAAAIGRISIGEMTKRGYKKDFAVGTVAAGGTLGIMIPPSITFVTYGILTENSIAKLLMAGLIPGIMLSVLLCVSIIVRAWINPALVGDTRRKGAVAGTQGEEVSVEYEEKKTTFLQDMKLMIPALVLIFIVLGSMYTGFATPTESAGFGAVGAFLIVLAQKRLTMPKLKKILLATVKTSCMILFLTICGFCMSYVISYLGIASKLAKVIVATGLSKWTVMILLYILWFILGCLMDPGSMIILTIPFVYPTLMALGFDPIWLGVVSVLCVEIGMITPPVGLNLFVLRSVADVDMKYIIKGAIPYVLILIAGLVILNVFPGLATWLPSRM